VPTPEVSLGSFKVSQHSTGNRIEVGGMNFGTDCLDLAVIFTPNVASNIVDCHDAMLFVDTAATNSLTLGDLLAVVSRSGGSSTAVKVGEVVAAVSAPSVTASVDAVSYKETMLEIIGSGFGTVIDDVKVYLIPTGGVVPSTIVKHVADTAISVMVLGLSEAHTGRLSGVVARQGVKNTAVIATLQEIVPEVSSVDPLVSPIEGGSVITIAGKNFQYDELQCLWGSTTATKAFGNGSVATCSTPRYAVGNATLTVKTAHGHLVHTTASLAFYPTLLVSDLKHDRVLRFSAHSGAFVDVFVQPSSGGLKGPQGLAFNPEHNLVVASSQTQSILQYDGSTGAFMKVFARLSTFPKGLTFHYGDLYVCGAHDRRIHRFHGITGSARGVFYESAMLRYPYSLMFDAFTNDTLVADMLQSGLVRAKSEKNNVDKNTHITFDEHLRSGQGPLYTRFSPVPMREVRSFDMSADSVYVTSPALGSAVTQFNRSTGEHVLNIEDPYMRSPSDVKIFNNFLYVCGENDVRKYNRYDGELMGTFINMDMACSFMIFHASWEPNRGS